MEPSPNLPKGEEQIPFAIAKHPEGFGIAEHPAEGPVKGKERAGGQVSRPGVRFGRGVVQAFGFRGNKKGVRDRYSR